MAMKKGWISFLSLLLAAAIFLSGCSSQKTEKVQSSSSSGDKSITVLVEGGSPAFKVAKETAEEFKSKTGYEVKIESVPYTGVYDKLKAEVASRAGAFDVATIDILWFPALAGGLLPLDGLLTDQVKSDLFPGLVSGGSYEGKEYGMPVWTNAKNLLYRKDLFEDSKNKQAFKAKYGYELAPPKTWQQYRDAAKFFTSDTDKDGKIDMYGTTVFGANNGDAVASWLDHAAQAGANPLVIDKDGKVLVNTKPYVDSLQFLSDLLRKDKSVPPGALEMASAETSELFWSGKSAMMLAWGHFYVPSNDAKQSKVAGKVGSAPMIAGSAGIGAVPGPWYQVIPSSSKKQEAAKQYLQFIYEKNELFMKTLGVAARKSVFEKYSTMKGYEHLQPLMETLKGPQTQNRPAIKEWQQIESEALIPAVQYVLSGEKTPQESLDWAKETIEGILPPK
ncbi:sugar ABC transporter substrate-binding protein [Metabacillus sp. GX 13764]|uniref:ABC transporter substrate-binding protein n=1 Tax=Metabacillus kandeliae TaxID=2900151 RepID=UPI001E3D8794|nr:sugar ABC transporter substrate-binding protein [Metabacillus kandeliae]MCD7036348.1 sugar ABC transporter substrate-binding protein [Metabacillus kandeliae]